MRTPDLIDDHFYNTPRAMERTSNQYDNLPLGRAFIWVRIFEGFADREQIRPLETEEALGLSITGQSGVAAKSLSVSNEKNWPRRTRGVVRPRPPGASIECR
jgi:hypothetical protein